MCECVCIHIYLYTLGVWTKNSFGRVWKNGSVCKILAGQIKGPEFKLWCQNEKLGITYIYHLSSGDSEKRGCCGLLANQSR